MSISQLCIYIAVYILPALYFFGLACVVLIQQSRRLENRLITAILVAYSFLYFGEFFRHLLPIEYSSTVSGIGLGLIGLLVSDLTLHLYIYVSNLYMYIPRLVYPGVFYVPFLILLLAQVIHWRTIPFILHEPRGLWYAPIYNEAYYIVLTISAMLNIIMLYILIIGLRKTVNIQKRKLLTFLIVCTVVVFTLKASMGYLNFGEHIPPYTFLIEGIVFSIFISFSFLHNDLLPNISRRYRTLFDISPIPIMILDDKLDILEINKQGKFLLNISDPTDMNVMKYARTEHNKKLLRKLIEQIQLNGTLRDYSLALDNLFLDGRIHISIDAKYVVTSKDRIYYVMLRDVTSEVEKEKMIMHLAYHDVLTDLHNRAFFVTHINKKLVELSKKTVGEAYFILLDLNHFKIINDSFGHSVGDQVLQYTAELLKDATNKRDLVARFGGDEFVLFLEGFRTREDFDEWLSQLRKAFKETSFVYNDIHIEVTPSIGIAYSPEQGSSFEDLFHVADLNMYADKESLKSRK
ncbi:sensor domain-containing diguanylate cyclase [Psychrobacillus sp. BL-248-WT-3]|uniref:sensor domain-containing diguanylate cyclase n=1 Tax=Psychrobacillus sp. BL-248-WT-3 TaxID=2725306 RepID=UPI00146BC6F4|nr:sensor domain-containing diguanylate cyclase [Psychrobacillus sp. BL-248-WT-3]NME06170.1 GGDEF domain-containing protein [Psychrobacillus sp. BL-248-WT-3]